MTTVFLIGYMGCGKSTLGRAVASRTGVEFTDLDHYIEQWQGCTVREIFDRWGEPRFRQLEREALTLLSQPAPSGTPAPAAATPPFRLVACGGGTPCQEGNMELMNSCGITVYLRTSHARLLERLKRGRAKRPLIAALDDQALDSFITAQLALREPHYLKASLSLDSTLLECAPDIDKRVDAFLDLIASSLDRQPGPHSNTTPYD